MKAIWLDSETQTVSEVEYDGLSDIQKRVGGYIERAYEWTHGDVLYVDEEGLFKAKAALFFIPERADQWLSGSGLIVGKEIRDTARTFPPKQTVEEVREKIRWGKA